MSIRWESKERDLNSFLIDTMLNKSQLKWKLLSAMNTWYLKSPAVESKCDYRGILSI